MAAGSELRAQGFCLLDELFVTLRRLLRAVLRSIRVPLQLLVLCLPPMNAERMLISECGSIISVAYLAVLGFKIMYNKKAAPLHPGGKIHPWRQTPWKEHETWQPDRK